MRKQEKAVPSYKQAEAPINLLWSGGWDSTFRLLSLIFDYDCAVQPFYVIDPERATLDREIETMEEIVRAIAAENTDGRVLQTLCIQKAVIADDVAMSDKYNRLEAIAPMGRQFDYLARLAKSHAGSRLELCVEKGVRSTTIYDLLSPYLQLDAASHVSRYRLAACTPDPIDIFCNFRLPVIEMTKLDMEAAARRSGFLRILEMAWTCHQPLFGRWPCGFCGSCKTTMMEGMQHRIGWRGITAYHTWGRFRTVVPVQLRRRIRNISLRRL